MFVCLYVASIFFPKFQMFACLRVKKIIFMHAFSCANEKYHLETQIHK